MYRHLANSYRLYNRDELNRLHERVENFGKRKHRK